MITQAICNSYKLEIFSGIHSSAHSYKIALFTSSSTLDKSTTSYTGSIGESSGMGYTAGGQPLSGFSAILDGDTACLDFSDLTWSNSTITARGALIYNDSLAGKNAVACLDFGSNIVSTAGNFSVIFPAPTANTALIHSL